MTGADLFKIEQKIPYAADYNTCIAQAKEDKQTGKRPEILNLPQDIDQYDEIYLGYPNYWGTMPMAVYTFLESYDFTGKKRKKKDRNGRKRMEKNIFYLYFIMLW